MKMVVRFLTLTGPLKTLRTETYGNPAAALHAVSLYAIGAGFTDLKTVDEGDGAGVRFTATTPGGRAGRNVAFGDWDGDFTGEAS